MMQPLYSVFTELAPRETRAAIVPLTQGKTPKGRYAFLEWFCNAPGCDCRRVLIQVVEESDYRTILATINFGWESAEFYARRFGGDDKSTAEIRAASLDPLNPQASLAEWMHVLFRQTGEVAAKIRSFGQKDLDTEITSFVLEVWTRLCRRKTADNPMTGPGRLAGE